MKFSDKCLIAASLMAIFLIIFFGEQWSHPKEFTRFAQGTFSGVQEFLVVVGSMLGVLFLAMTTLGVWFTIVRIKSERGVIRSREKSQAIALRKQHEHEEIIQLTTPALHGNTQHYLVQFKQVAQLYTMLLREARRYGEDMDDKKERADPNEQLEFSSSQTCQAIVVPQESLYLSANYSAPANDFLSGRKLIVGISGSGKSNTVGVYGEELGRLRVPFILADTEDEYQPLCHPQWLSHGILAGAIGTYSVSIEDAPRFGRYVLEHNKQVILNLLSYDMIEAAKVMIGLIAGMRIWQEERENEHRIPCEFILEEAVTWLPQYVNESPLKAKDPQTLAALQNTFFNDLVRKGRKRGLGITLVCQKIAELDNRAMQSDGKLLHRQAEEADLERYRKMGITREETLSLKNGEAFLFSSHESKRRIQIRRRFSPHGANTPGLEQLRRHQQASGNAGEMWGNFPCRLDVSPSEENAFDPSTEPLRGATGKFPGSPSAAEVTAEGEIPEKRKAEILDLYRQNVKRSEIRDRLGLGGKEYWMIRDVCNEYDRLHAKGDA